MISIVILIFTQCDGDRSLYLINSSRNPITIKSISLPSKFPYSLSSDSWQKWPLQYYNNRKPELQLKPNDSIFPNLQIEYCRIILDTRSSIRIDGDTLSVELKPNDSLRIAQVSHIFGTGRVREPSLQFDNLIVITNSDTYFLRSRQEILSRKRIKGLKMKKIEEWR